MSFDDFKSRYRKYLMNVGITEIPGDERLAEIFIGLVIMNDFHIEEFKKAEEQQKQQIINNSKLGVIH